MEFLILWLFQPFICHFKLVIGPHRSAEVEGVVFMQHCSIPVPLVRVCKPHFMKLSILRLFQPFICQFKFVIGPHRCEEEVLVVMKHCSILVLLVRVCKSHTYSHKIEAVFVMK